MSEAAVQLKTVIPQIVEQLEQGGNVQLAFQGTSMLPMVLGGRDEVILSPVTAPLKKYDVPFYRRDNGQFVLHRIVKAGESYTCIGDNQFLYERGVRQDQVLAVMTGFVRKGKTYAVTQPGYKLYCRVWHWSRFPRKVYRRVLGYVRCLFRRKNTR